MTAFALILSPECPWWSLPVALVGAGGLVLLVWRLVRNPPSR
jgi:hypothetical protein